MKLRNTPKEYQEYYHNTDKPMPWPKWQAIENAKKKDNFPSHNPPKKTLWDKIDKDLLFRTELECRNIIDEDGNVLGRTMANRRFVPRKNK